MRRSSCFIPGSWLLVVKWNVNCSPYKQVHSFMLFNWYWRHCAITEKSRHHVEAPSQCNLYYEEANLSLFLNVLFIYFLKSCFLSIVKQMVNSIDRSNAATPYKREALSFNSRGKRKTKQEPQKTKARFF